MKPNYLDLFLFGVLGVVTLIALLRIRPRKAPRLAPAKIRRDDSAIVIRRRISRW